MTATESHLDELEPHPVLRRRLDLGLWRRLLGYAGPHRRAVRKLVLAALGMALCDAGLPLVTGWVLDSALEEGLATTLAWAMGAYGVLILGSAACVLGFVRAGGYVRSAVAHDIRAAAFASLQRLSIGWFDKRPVGWLLSRLTSDCERLSQILTWGTLDLVWGSAVLATCTAVMLVLDVRLALCVLSVVPALAALSLFFQRRILASARGVRRVNSRLTATYGEAVLGVRTTRLFAREQESDEAFGRIAQHMRELSLRNALESALYLPLVLSVSSLGVGLALVLGGVELGMGALSTGTVVAFLTYARRLFDPLGELARVFADMQMGQAAAERVLSLVDEVPSIADSQAVRARLAAAPHGPGLARDGHPEPLGALRFEGVGFEYVAGEPVLDGVDLELPPGSTLALVGPTGGGKSTLASLAARFLEPTAGRVTVGGIDLRERSLSWLRGKLAIVLQTPHLFQGTVLENIRYGRPDASEAEVRAAAEAVGAKTFIEALPQGYASEVGEAGGRLSTGERQLVSFARALLAEPELLILDEATSSLDAETERGLQRGVERLTAGRTTIVIAHRLSTIERADQIAVLEGGRVVELGDHARLLAQGGRYAELVGRQHRAQDGTVFDLALESAP